MVNGRGRGDEKEISLSITGESKVGGQGVPTSQARPSFSSDPLASSPHAATAPAA